MDIKLGAPVVSCDGAELGRIDKVIFDPQSSETKEIVVRQGAILPRDVAISLAHIRVAAPTRVELSLSREEVDRLLEFVEDEYAWPPSQWIAPYGWPAGGVLWPAAYLGAPGTDVPYTAPC
jgi:sporulation protein YlmC with PRC-barrel domain